jgi:hypothetical protein
VGPYFPGNFVGALWPIGQVVSQTKFGCNVDNVRHPVCMCHLDQLRVRWRCFSLAVIVLRHPLDAAFSASSLASSSFTNASCHRAWRRRCNDAGARHDECDLADQFRGDPAALIHFLRG